MGEELIETLQVYFDSGENRRRAARRLHLADRTVAYRLERIGYCSDEASKVRQADGST